MIWWVLAAMFIYVVGGYILVWLIGMMDKELGFGCVTLWTFPLVILGLGARRILVWLRKVFNRTDSDV